MDGHLAKELDFIQRSLESQGCSHSCFGTLKMTSHAKLCACSPFSLEPTSSSLSPV